MHIFLKPILLLFILFLAGTDLHAQSDKRQKGLLWQITGNGLKKPSYVYGTMHVSQKIAFHLGDSFYIALSKSDVVALEQDLDSVIHRWITESGKEENGKVNPRNKFDFLTLFGFTLTSYNKTLIQRKLSAEVSEVNYLLTRGEQDDFEEDAWLDLYIYQLAKKLGKACTGVEGYEESRDLVKQAMKEPKGSSDKKKKRSFDYKLRQLVAEAYRKGDIYLIDSIDRLTETEHYLEYMLYRRNANMVRRMDSIMRKGKSLFTGVGCSHLPGGKGVLQMLTAMGYTVRPVQSIALEKSRLAGKIENRQVRHRYQEFHSSDGLISAMLPARLSKVSDNSFYSSYLSPDLANGYYYQIEKITCNTVFAGKTPSEILLEIDTMIFENIPGEIIEKSNTNSNGMEGIYVTTRLKTGDLNRFLILASPFHVFIIRLSGKKEFAVSKQADRFFRSLQIREGLATVWHRMHAPDSIFTLELPGISDADKIPGNPGVDNSYEYLVFDQESNNTYLIKQLDILNEYYLEKDSFELNVMARSFANTDRYRLLSKKHFNWQGYHAMDAVFETKNNDSILARFAICGTRYLMFVMKPEGHQSGFGNRFFASIRFNGKPAVLPFEYYDSTFYFRVRTPVLPLLAGKEDQSGYFGGAEEDEEDNPYKGQYREMYFTTGNANEFVIVGNYRYGLYENQKKDPVTYRNDWKKSGSLTIVSSDSLVKNGVFYKIYTYSDTGTNRQFRVMHALHGRMRYYVEAYLDPVSGSNPFVDSFFHSFDVSDTLLDENIFAGKGSRFFRDFTGDSAQRKAAINHFSVVNFGRKDLKDLFTLIDTLSMRSDAAKLRIPLIQAVGNIDSASGLIIPYLSGLYKRFDDTAHLQIVILQTLAALKTDSAFMAIRPVLANDIPISDDAYEMRSMLEKFGDSLKLTRIILPELIELTGIPEYRRTAYEMLSVLKDSGLINETDYAGIHDKLIRETRIEYKRMLALLTREGNSEQFEGIFEPDGRSLEHQSDYNLMNATDFGALQFASGLSHSSSGNEGISLREILDLSLPLRGKSTEMQNLVSRMLRLTNNQARLYLLPVLLKYGIQYHDSVYLTLASSHQTMNHFYNLMAEAGELSRFPKTWLNHRHWILSDIRQNENEYTRIDTIMFLHTRKVVDGHDSGLVYACKFRLENESDWYLYLSDALPDDSSRLNHPSEIPVFESRIIPMRSENDTQEITDELIFENTLKRRRVQNGGAYFSGMSVYNMFGSWGF